MLSFNYDRLFEIAFTDYFKLDPNMDYYGQAWLNSSLNFLHKEAVAINHDRFCFLKLHGTVGIWVAKQYGQSRYGLNATLHNVSLLVDDELFWPANYQPSSFRSENPEPLIVFPFEKDRARSGGTSFLFDNYIRTIWGHREQPGYTEKLVQEAEQIWVIGYSFDPNDRRAMIELLRKSDCEIVVQNRTKEGAEAICGELKLQYHDIVPRLKPFGKPF